MKERTIWNETRSLLVTYNFKNEDDIKGFRKALDKQLNLSTVDRVIIIVNVPRGVDKTKLSLKGITAQAIKDKVSVTIGANTKIILFALDGIIISLKRYLSASASVCSKPKGPTTFGPFLF